MALIGLLALYGNLKYQDTLVHGFGFKPNSVSNWKNLSLAHNSLSYAYFLHDSHINFVLDFAVIHRNTLLDNKSLLC